MERPETDGMDELGRELRDRVGGELRAEAEEAERHAARAARRRQAIVDLARLHMARGETVAVTLAGRRFTGAVVQAAGDLLSLDTPRGRVDVRTTAPFTLTVAGGRPRGPGREPPPAAAGSFLARLRQLELEAAGIELGLEGAGTARGVLTVVATDHVVVAVDDGEVVVSLPAIQWVAAQDGGRRSRG